MRREYELTATNGSFVADLPFQPTTIVILNNTDKSVYLTIGSLLIPSATFYDREVLPTASGIPSNVALPNNSTQFAGFLPTPTDTTKRVTVIFQGTADPFSNRPKYSGGIPTNLRNYREFRMKVGLTEQVWELPFRPDMCFILNNSDAPLYIHEGSGQIPTASYYDLTYPAKSYTMLIPQGGWHYGAFLDTPTEKDCFIIFAFGYADEYKALQEALGEWDWFLPSFFLGYEGGITLEPSAEFMAFLDETIPGGEANFTYDDSGTEFQFCDTSTGVVNDWYWTFGDGNSSILQSPLHVYANPGAYTARLRINGESEHTEPIITGLWNYTKGANPFGQGDWTIGIGSWDGTNGFRTQVGHAVDCRLETTLVLPFATEITNVLLSWVDTQVAGQAGLVTVKTFTLATDVVAHETQFVNWVKGGSPADPFLLNKAFDGSSVEKIFVQVILGNTTNSPTAVLSISLNQIKGNHVNPYASLSC